MRISQAAQRRTGKRAEATHRLLRYLLWLVPLAVLAFAGTREPAVASGVTLTPTIQVQSGGVANQNTVFFGNVANLPAGCQVILWSWSFGDGQTGSNQTVSHVYTANSTYNVQLQVFDNCSDSGVTSQQVTIGGGTTGNGCTGGSGQIGISVTAIPNVASVNSQIVFNASTSGGATAYFWTFGDGQSTQTTNTQTTHVYTVSGSFTVTVTASSGGLFGCGSTSVTINGSGGTTSSIGGIQVTANGPYTGNVNQPVTFHGFAYPTNAGFTITGYNWNFGDGATGSGQDTSHTYTSNGSFTVTLTATDSGGDSATNTTTVTIGGSGSTSGTTVSGSSATLDGITVSAGGPYTGSAGATITFTATTSGGGATVTSYVWSFGDGGSGTGQSTTHTYSGNGTFAVALTVTDSLSHVATATTSANISGGSRVVSLKQGCNAVALTFSDNTPTGTVLTAVSPQSAVLSIWKLTDPTTGHYSGYFPNSTQASDLTTVLRLDAVSICVNGAATLSEPAV